MADKKISQLTAATTPLDGTEVLPIVQSGTTVKVQNNDLRPKQIQSNATSGVLQVIGPAAASTRVMTVPNANFTAARTDASQTFTNAQTIQGTSSVRNTITRLAVIDGGTAVGNPYAGFGQGQLFTGRDYSDANRQYGYIDAVMTASSSSTPGGDPGFKTALVFGTNPGGAANTTPIDQFKLDENGNLVPINAAKGINFTANTAAAGMTSQLLNWYEEGTWTPGQGAGLTVVGTFSSSGTYTRIGRQVTVTGRLQGSTSVATTAASAMTTGLPFTVGQTNNGAAVNNAYDTSTVIIADAGSTSIYSVGVILATTNIWFSVTYIV